MSEPGMARTSVERLNHTCALCSCPSDGWCTPNSLTGELTATPLEDESGGAQAAQRRALAQPEPPCRMRRWAGRVAAGDRPPIVARCPEWLSPCEYAAPTRHRAPDDRVRRASGYRGVHLADPVRVAHFSSTARLTASVAHRSCGPRGQRQIRAVVRRSSRSSRHGGACMQRALRSR
jgi:hypothetical protein